MSETTRLAVKEDEESLHIAFQEVEAEVRRAIRKWPMPCRDPLQQIVIIIEELGEACRPLNDRWNSDKDGWYEEFREEMIQAAAMCIRALMEVQPSVTYVTRGEE